MRGGLLLIALAAVAWGTSGSVTTILVTSAGAEPLLIGAGRMAVAAVLLLVGVRLLTGPLTIARADVPRCLAMGACMALFQVAYFTAVPMTGIAVTALIAICSAPLMIAALAAGLLGERLTRRVLVALALGVAGTALLVAGSAAGPARPAAFAVGALLALAAGLAYALYVILAKFALAGSAPLPLTALTFAVAALLSLPALGWTRDPGDQISRGWPWIVYLGSVATAGAYALYTTGLRRVPASAAGIVSLLEPLTATLLGVVVFGERLAIGGVAGALALLGAVALLLGAAGREPADADVRRNRWGRSVARLRD